MSEDEPTGERIPLDDEDTEILTAYTPNFDRVFARGSLLRTSEDDPETLQIGFWTDRDQDIELDDGEIGTGYRLESEAVMTWRTARRLRELLDIYIKEYAPEEYKEIESSGDD